MEYNQLCFELLQIAKSATDEKTTTKLLELISDIEKNGVTD